MSARRRTLTVALCLAAAGGAARPPAEAGIVQRLNYETGNLQQWTGVQALPGRARIIRSPVRQGRFAARFVVRPGDNPIGASGERSEVYALTGEQDGVTSWWAWSTRFPRSFRANPGGWNIFTQWHQTGAVCSPPVSFAVERTDAGSYLVLRVRGGRLDTRSCEASYSRDFRLGALRRGRWFNFRFHVGWSAQAHVGFVELWVNGRLRARTQAATLYSGQGVYLKQGFYRGAGSTVTSVIHDGTRRLSG